MKINGLTQQEWEDVKARARILQESYPGALWMISTGAECATDIQIQTLDEKLEISIKQAGALIDKQVGFVIERRIRHNDQTFWFDTHPGRIIDFAGEISALLDDFGGMIAEIQESLVAIKLPRVDTES